MFQTRESKLLLGPAVSANVGGVPLWFGFVQIGAGPVEASRCRRAAHSNEQRQGE